MFQDVTGFAKGTLLEYRAVLKDASGNLSATSSYGVVGDPAPAGGGGGGVGPVDAAGRVSRARQPQQRDGLPRRLAAGLRPGPADARPQRRRSGRAPTRIPAGAYEYKAAINKSWDENYGAGGVSERRQHRLHRTAARRSRSTTTTARTTHLDAQGPIITAPGPHQSEIGCGGDWDPACMRTWLQDPDGDGTFTWSGVANPGRQLRVQGRRTGSAGTRTTALGGAPNGANIAVIGAQGRDRPTFSYVLETHIATTTTLRRRVRARPHPAEGASGSSRDLARVARRRRPAGTDPALLRWRLHWSPTGEPRGRRGDLVGGSSAELTHDAAGLPAAVVAAHPELKGYLALRLDPKTAKQAETILRGQVAVAMYDDHGSLLDATGMQIPLVLDDLYAGAGREGHVRGPGVVEPAHASGSGLPPRRRSPC